MKLTFNPIEHIYRLDGVVIPGFSEIAKAMGISDYSGASIEILEAARNFGKQMHLATKLWDEKNLGLLPKPLIPWMETYKKFLKNYSVKIIQKYIEKPICSYRYRFGVTPDRICLVSGELSVLEIKTTTVMPNSVKLQTAAQTLAAEEYYGIRIRKRYGLKLSPGDYKVYPYKDEMDKQVFIAFLSAYNWLKKNVDKSR